MPMEHDEQIQLFADAEGLVWLPLVAERLFAAHVREGRVARGWTQAVLAEQLSARGVPMSQSGVAKLERSDDSTRRPIRLNEAAALASLFRQSLRDMTQTRAAASPEQRRLLEAKQRYTEAMAAVALAQRDLADAEQKLVDAQAALASV
jgi:transcriptional regulator with XRE-family HTH domain